MVLHFFQERGEPVSHHLRIGVQNHHVIRVRLQEKKIVGLAESEVRIWGRIVVYWDTVRIIGKFLDDPHRFMKLILVAVCNYENVHAQFILGPEKFVSVK